MALSPASLKRGSPLCVQVSWPIMSATRSASSSRFVLVRGVGLDARYFSAELIQEARSLFLA
jgi:hypothetical protein